MARPSGSLSAENCVVLLKHILNEHQLCFDNDIVGITTDGASVMKKVGNLLPCFQQLCLVYRIHLAVVKTVYKQKALEQEATVANAYFENDDDDDSDPDYDDEVMDEGITILNHLNSNEIIETNNIRDIIEKIRKIVKIFKRSLTKNDDILQMNV